MQNFIKPLNKTRSHELFFKTINILYKDIVDLIFNIIYGRIILKLGNIIFIIVSIFLQDFYNRLSTKNNILPHLGFFKCINKCHFLKLSFMFFLFKHDQL